MLLDAVVPIVSFGLVDGTPLYLISLLLALGLLTKAVQVSLMPRYSPPGIQGRGHGAPSNRSRCADRCVCGTRRSSARLRRSSLRAGPCEDKATSGMIRSS